MPIYEYRCRDCGVEFEVLVRDGDPVTCPHCRSGSLQKLLSPPFVSSRRTARPTGRTCCGQEERCAAPPCSSGDTCRRESAIDDLRR
jgi:putative FmdB family regulatory protein